jgi:prevent-host-death family protein
MKTVSATEAKNRFGTFLGEVSRGELAVVIENHGKPTAVLVSYEEWAALTGARERLRRQEAWDRFLKLAEEIGARNVDLTPEEADALADELGDEAKRRVASRLDGE